MTLMKISFFGIRNFGTPLAGKLAKAGLQGKGPGLVWAVLER